MFAITFDMTAADLRVHHPKGIAATYSDIGRVLAPFGFERVQGSVYLAQTADIARLSDAITALKTLPWFRPCASADFATLKNPHRDISALDAGQQ